MGKFWFKKIIKSKRNPVGLYVLIYRAEIFRIDLEIYESVLKYTVNSA